MNKLTKKEIEENEELLEHLNLDFDNALALFRNNRINGFMLAISYDENNVENTAFGLSGDFKTTLRAILTGLESLTEQAELMKKSKGTKH